jgi:hypothetical protein
MAKKKADLFSKSFAEDRKKNRDNSILAERDKSEVLSDTMLREHEKSLNEKIKINPELESLIPPLSAEELENLEVSLKKEGCREPLIVWENREEYTLVDGHNRYRLCTKNEIPFKIRLKKFETILEAKDWMLANQMSRRNLSPLQLSYLRGLRYENEKQSYGGKRESNDAGGHNDHLPSKTAEKLSEEYGVGEKTIRRDARFTMGLNKLTGKNQQLRWKILNGQLQAKKSTVSNLADQDDEFIDQLQSKLSETDNLEKALKILTQIESESKSFDEESTDETQMLYKKLVSLLKEIKKLDKKDPKRKEVVKEAKSLFNEYLK